MSLESATLAAMDLHNEAAIEAVKIDLLALFQGRGFQSSKLILACVKKWGRRAPELLRRNPYLLMIHGLPSAGFKRCDKLYLDLKHSPDRLKRQTLCGWHALHTDQSGHTWMRAAVVDDAIQKSMRGGQARAERAVRLGVRSGWLSTRTDADGKVFLAERGKARAEETAAREVLRLSRG